MGLLEHCIIPDWPAPANVKALQTKRLGGISAAPYDLLNLGAHVGDDSRAVTYNRQLLEPLMPSEPVWLEQVHGTTVVNADATGCLPQADACIARHRGAVCVVMTADCLPVLLCDDEGAVVGAAHAGWKGLAKGVIEETVKAMNIAPHKLMAWLGPAISQEAFEVGEDVRGMFVGQDARATEAFIPSHKHGKFQGDIYLLAHQRLHALGVDRIYGGNYCTFLQKDEFFSYRRDGVTGRMGTFIWLT
jgi:YfiH family protein